jgi:hypothetical protein
MEQKKDDAEQKKETKWTWSQIGEQMATAAALLVAVAAAIKSMQQPEPKRDLAQAMRGSAEALRKHDEEQERKPKF